MGNARHAKSRRMTRGRGLALCIAAVLLGACGGGSSGGGSAVPPGLNERTAYSNPGDAMLYQFKTASGEVLTYFGRRDGTGSVTVITDLDYVDAGGQPYRIGFDSDGLPASVVDATGTTVVLDYSRQPVTTPAAATTAKEIAWSQVPFIDTMVALAQVGGTAEVRTRVVPEGSVPVIVGIEPSIPELRAIEPTGNVEVSVTSCNTPIRATRGVTVNVRGVLPSPSVVRRYPALPKTDSGRFVAQIPTRAGSPVPAVCQSFADTLNKACNLVNPVPGVVNTPLADPAFQSSFCLQVAAAVTPLTTPAGGASAGAACLALLKGGTLACSTLGFTNSSAPDARNVAQALCDGVTAIDSGVGFDQYEIQAVWAPEGLSPSLAASGDRPLATTSRLVSVPSSGPFPELAIDAREPAIAAIRTSPVVPAAGRAYTADADFSCAKDSDLSITAVRDGVAVAQAADPAGRASSSATLSLAVPGAPTGRVDTLQVAATDPAGLVLPVGKTVHVVFPERPPVSPTQPVRYTGTGTTVDGLTYTNGQTIRCESTANWEVTVNPGGTLYGRYVNPKPNRVESYGGLHCAERQTADEITFSGSHANGRFEIRPSSGVYYNNTSHKFMEFNTVMTGDVDAGRIATNPIYSINWALVTGGTRLIQHAFDLVPGP